MGGPLWLLVFNLYVRAPVGPVHVVGIGVLALVSSLNLGQLALHGGIKKLDLGVLFQVGPDGDLPVQLGVYLDFYSSYMVWVVFCISWLVQTYSLSYIAHDPRLSLFMAYLTLFTFFMVVLLVAPNYVQLFMGWEGVGLTSYLLVNFWTTRTAANKSALKALVVNRVGDLFFLAGLLLLVREGCTLSWGAWAFLPAGVGPLWIGAAAAKSAQLGLHTWLPDAIEGPTPVSALIHAATIVTAGLFLLFRSTHFVFPWGTPLALVGAGTALFAGSVALFQFDLKRVIAYSTCSQLGYIVVAYSLGHPEISLFHLGNHAFFKALLFLGAGLVIHAVGDEQDFRRHGGLARVIPVTYTLFVVGSLGLGGFPFLSGFYSKDLLLETLYAQQNWWAYYGCVGAAYCTAYYSVRTLVYVFGGRPRGPRGVYLATTEADPRSLGVVVTLGGATLLHGWTLRDLVVGWGVHPGWSVPTVEAEFGVSWGVKLLPLGVSLGAAGAALVGLHGGRAATLSVLGWFTRRWGWDLVDTGGSRRGLTHGVHVYTSVERGLLEHAGPTGVVWLVGRTYDLFRNRGWLAGMWLLGLTGLVGLAFLDLPGELALPLWVPDDGAEHEPGEC